MKIEKICWCVGLLGLVLTVSSVSQAQEPTATSDTEFSIDTKIVDQTIVIGPDGKIIEQSSQSGGGNAIDIEKIIEEANKKISEKSLRKIDQHKSSIQTTVTVIGPDGKQTTKSIANGVSPNNKEVIDMIMNSIGGVEGLPDNLRGSLEKSLGNAMNQPNAVSPTGGEPGSSPDNRAVENATLGKILRKLDDLSREVDAIKKRSNTPN